MKCAFYMEDGLEQIVLTPENKTEESILAKIHDGSRTISLKKGSFYTCRGGYVRYKMHATSTMYGGSDSNDESTMIVLHRAEEEKSNDPDRPAD